MKFKLGDKFGAVYAGILAFVLGAFVWDLVTIITNIDVLSSSMELKETSKITILNFVFIGFGVVYILLINGIKVLSYLIKVLNREGGKK